MADHTPQEATVPADDATCPRCDGDGCDPAVWAGGRSGMAPDPCLTCGGTGRVAPTLLDLYDVHPLATPAGAPGHSNFAALRDGVADARAALGAVAVPLPADSANAYAALYYPLLFLTETVEATLRHVLRQAHDGVREENEGAAAFLAAASRGALATPAEAPSEADDAAYERVIDWSLKRAGARRTRRTQDGAA